MEFILSAFADEADKMLDGQMDSCLENGVNHIELRGVDGRNITDLTINEVKEVGKRLKARGFKLSAVGSPLGKINITDDFAPHLEKFKHTAEIANILGTKNIRLFSFFIPKGGNADDYKDEVFSRISAFVEHGNKAGVRCCHENEKDIYGDNAERCHTLLSEFKGAIDGIFDFSNFVQCGVDTLAAYDLLEPLTTYYHIKDALYNGQVVPAGKGDGNIQKILEIACKKEGRCFLTVEPHLTVFEGFAALERDGESMKTPFTYASNREAFKVAVQSLKSMLTDIGYREINDRGQLVWMNS